MVSFSRIIFCHIGFCLSTKNEQANDDGPRKGKRYARSRHQSDRLPPVVGGVFFVLYIQKIIENIHESVYNKK
ncbi:hypothetical protein I656_03980 [Geobacillus sp. WSUCF1]|nr:hypothetical protein I656_03980 [Geobacillus sp. WSUCF1]